MKCCQSGEAVLTYRNKWSDLVLASFLCADLTQKAQPPENPRAQLSVISKRPAQNVLYNALYLELPLETTEKLQLIQNVAARMLRGANKYDQMTPILCELHWLLIRLCVQFKVLILSFKTRNGLEPRFLQNCLHYYHPLHTLWSRWGGSAREAISQRI